jgi:subtilisin family serine protease
MIWTRIVAAIGAVGIAGSLVAISATAQATPGPSDAKEWWFDTWHVPDLWASGADGRGITVAVVDTGVQATLPELRGKVLPGADYISNGTDGRVDFDASDFSHGTGMASIIVARKGAFGIQGLAPAAKILPIAVPLKGVIKRGPRKADATSQSIRYAADHGAKVISMSLGGFRYDGADVEPCPSSMQDAVIYALAKGSLVVAASGNSGANGSPVEEPGVCLGVISVGAVNQKLGVASFSSRHPYLTLAAPGDHIPTLSRDPGRAFIGGGTSHATALASAALALVWSKFPHDTNRQLLSRVLATATDRGIKGHDSEYGFGLINPEAAIRTPVPASAPNAVFDGLQPLILLAANKQKKPPMKRAAGVADSSIGQVSIGKQPSGLDTGLRTLMIGTGALLILACALFLAGIRSRPRAYST